MKKLLIIITIFLPVVFYGQVFNHEKVCGDDTITIRYDLKYGDTNYRAVLCTQVSKLGFRFNLGFSSFHYYGGTNNWIGNHNAALIGMALVVGKLNFAANCKLASVTPGAELVFNGDTITNKARLNPGKIDFTIGYSIDLKHNFSFEPHVGVTKNLLYAENEQDLNKTYDIPHVYGMNTGVTINKYFSLKEFKFVTCYVSYNYGFTNFKKINAHLGKGYSEWTFGVAYKIFAKRNFHEKVGYN